MRAREALISVNPGYVIFKFLDRFIAVSYWTQLSGWPRFKCRGCVLIDGFIGNLHRDRRGLIVVCNTR